MTIFRFSASTLTFYDSRLSKIFPDDAVIVTDAVYETMVSGRIAGKVVSADSSGKPVLSDRIESDAQKWASYQAKAQVALTDSDITVLRCTENGITVPVEWVVYRKSLRAIISESQPATIPTTLPTKPDYPTGT